MWTASSNFCVKSPGYALAPSWFLILFLSVQCEAKYIIIMVQKHYSVTQACSLVLLFTCQEHAVYTACSRKAVVQVRESVCMVHVWTHHYVLILRGVLQSLHNNNYINDSSQLFSIMFKPNNLSCKHAQHTCFLMELQTFSLTHYAQLGQLPSN